MNIGCEKESISKVRKEFGELSFYYNIFTVNIPYSQ